LIERDDVVRLGLQGRRELCKGLRGAFLSREQRGGGDAPADWIERPDRVHLRLGLRGAAADKGRGEAVEFEEAEPELDVGWFEGDGALVRRDAFPGEP
jgi:hypothetical protein